MPKKSVTARRGAQRNKPKAQRQKSIELVRPVSQVAEENEPEVEAESSDETTAVSVTAVETSTAESEKESGVVALPSRRDRARRGKASVTQRDSEDEDEVATSSKEDSTKKGKAPTVQKGKTLTAQSEDESSVASTAPKGSAAARLAARRQAGQKAQQRAAASLITAEHYSYVRKDLVFIAILAIIMFTVIIVLHFVPGIGS